MSNIKLLSLTEKSIYNTSSHQLLTILFVSLIISIMIGIVITYYFSFYNYRPIHEIMGYLKEYPMISEETNEYNKIKKMITSSNTEIKRQRLLLKNNYIIKILLGELPLSQLSSSTAEQFHLNFNAKHSYVVLIRHELTKDSENLFPSNDSIDSLSQLIFFIIQNILSELCSPELTELHYCLINRDTAIIVNIPESLENAEAFIEKRLYTFIDYCQTYYHIRHYAGISDLNDNQNLSVAYTQANNALEYLQLFSTGNLCKYRDTPSQPQIGYLNLKNSDYILNLVLTANQHALKDYFAGLNDELLHTRLSTTDAKSCLYFFYNISMRLKVRFLQLYPYHNQLNMEFVDNRFFEYSFTEALHTIEKLFLEVSRLIKEQKSILINKKTDEVASYIENNYFDINLNVNHIADHFHVTPSYLSRKFKEDHGYTIIGYLYKIRIEHSLPLICNSSLRIIDIAQMLGFQDSNAFIRIFKQYQGCTPGQYKKMQ